MGRVADKLAQGKKEGYLAWLMKTEPDAFSIDDLKKEGTAAWDGVRNFQARNFMRYEMKPCDDVLFYHSSCKPPGIVGLARVASETRPDESQFDKKNKYYDAGSRPEKPKWYLVDIGFRKIFKEMVTLQQIRQESSLKEMLVVQRGMRLSIQPVLKKEFEIILKLSEKLI